MTLFRPTFLFFGGGREEHGRKTSALVRCMAVGLAIGCRHNEFAIKAACLAGMIKFSQVSDIARILCGGK
jgi:hypothetical protein